MWTVASRTPHIALWSSVRLPATIALAAVGLLFMISGVMAFRSARTTINPVDIEAASALVTGGVFRRTRNPMYVGFTLLLLAWALYLAAPWTLLGVAVFIAFIQRFQILPEERVMRAKFGEAYAQYAVRVRRWL